jgi:hypothetical protein
MVSHVTNHFPPLLLVGILWGCAPAGGGEPEPPACDYPEGAVDPMELDQVIHPYSWPAGLAVGDDRSAPLALGDMPCAASDDIDWSPFDVLLFVSIPAW